MRKIKIDGHAIDEESLTMLQTLVDRKRNGAGRGDKQGRKNPEAMRTPALSDAASITHSNSARHRLVNHLKPLGWVETAGSEPTTGAAENATLWRATDAGEEWLSERAEVIEAPPARDAARALAITEHLEERVAELEDQIDSTAMQQEVETLREDLEETNELAESARDSIEGARDDGTLDERIGLVEDQADVAETKAKNARSSGPSSQEVRTAKSKAKSAGERADSAREVADEAATEEEVEILRKGIRNIEEELHIPSGSATAESNRGSEDAISRLVPEGRGIHNQALLMSILALGVTVLCFLSLLVVLV